MARDMIAMWGEQVAQRGFTQIPNYLVMLNQFLDEEAQLTPVQLLVIYQLVAAWWEKDKPPFPSMRTIATRIGVSERQVMRSITQLERRGLIQRVKRRARGVKASNAYDLSGLLGLLNEIDTVYQNAYPRAIKGTGMPSTVVVDTESDIPDLTKGLSASSQNRALAKTNNPFRKIPRFLLDLSESSDGSEQDNGEQEG